MKPAFYIDCLTYLSGFGIGEMVDLKPIIRNHINLGLVTKDPNWVANITNDLKVLKNEIITLN